MRDKTREGRLRWYGHVQRRGEEHIGQRVLQMELPGERGVGRPKTRFMDNIKEDMKKIIRFYHNTTYKPKEDQSDVKPDYVWQIAPQ